MPEIQIIAKDSHKTLVTTEELLQNFPEASVVLVKVAASDVLVVNREGTNAVIRLKMAKLLLLKASLVVLLNQLITVLYFKIRMVNSFGQNLKMLKMMQMLTAMQMQMPTVMWSHKHF